MSKPLVEFSNIHKSYDEKVILNGISFEVYPGETLAIIGPSGTGKSTALKIIAGLEKPDSGEVILRDCRLSMVFQYSALLNSYTVGENVGFALHDSHLPQEEIDKTIVEKLTAVGLVEYTDRLPDQLSGGQQKRVSFARAVAIEPHIILYDEPTAGLDPISSTLVENYIKALAETGSAAGIVVTHQFSTIRRTAQRIICLNKGDIVWAGSVEELDTSDNPFIRQFMDASVTGPFNDG